MKCRLKLCKACCCYNVPFYKKFFDEHKDKIVNKIMDCSEIGSGAILPFTDLNPLENKCPFLRSDYRCNIYNERPDVCRKMGEIDKMICDFRK